MCRMAQSAQCAIQPKRRRQAAGLRSNGTCTDVAWNANALCVSAEHKPKTTKGVDGTQPGCRQCGRCPLGCWSRWPTNRKGSLQRNCLGQAVACQAEPIFNTQPPEGLSLPSSGRRPSQAMGQAIPLAMDSYWQACQVKHSRPGCRLLPCQHSDKQ